MLIYITNRFENVTRGTTVTSATAPYVISSTPSGMQLRWINSSGVISGSSPVTADTFTPYYYNVASSCYYPAGNSITITANPSNISVSPATQTLTLNDTPTNLAVTATNVTSYQWYSNVINSNTGGILISGATSSVYTPLTNATGMLYYYVIAKNGTDCSTSSSAVQVIVQSSCLAGSIAPAIH